jgi:hypothetical protein
VLRRGAVGVEFEGSESPGESMVLVTMITGQDYGWMLLLLYTCVQPLCCLVYGLLLLLLFRAVSATSASDRENSWEEGVEDDLRCASLGAQFVAGSMSERLLFPGCGLNARQCTGC